MKFSIIMPVYNAGTFLRPAIESVLSQTFTDFELLLIDDGSTDGSANICDDAARNDNRIRVYHRQNGGICQTRNFGITQSSGEYITFCDHDDYYYPNYLQSVSDKLARSDVMVDIVKVNYEVYDRHEDGHLAVVSSGAKGDDTKWSDSCPYEFLSRITSMAWDGAYRRSLLVTGKLFFDDSFTCGGEDADFSLRCVSSASNAIWIHNICYRHYTNFGVSTSSKFHSNLITDYLRVAERERSLFPSVVRKDPVAHFRRWLAGLQNFIFRSPNNPMTTYQMAKVYAMYMKQLLPTSVALQPKNLGEYLLAFLSKCHLSLVYGYSKALHLRAMENN